MLFGFHRELLTFVGAVGARTGQVVAAFILEKEPVVCLAQIRNFCCASAVVDAYPPLPDFQLDVRLVFLELCLGLSIVVFAVRELLQYRISRRTHVGLD